MGDDDIDINFAGVIPNVEETVVVAYAIYTI